MDRMRLWHGACAALLLAAGLLATPVNAQVQYIHTDALGSVVAVTDANRNVIERREFAPYGDQLNAPAADRGPSYTGHVEDGLTGLTYMQQRYYDPAIGRFLSVDPVGPLEDPLQHFGRYHYANNNPYKYTDPDGRLPFLIIPAAGALIGGGINLGVQLSKSDGNFSQVSLGQVGVAAGAGALGGFAGGVAASAATTGGMIVANLVSGAAIGAVATHANAMVTGESVSVGDVVKGAALGGGLAAAGGVISGAPAAAQRAVVSGMTQTERVAAQNLVNHIEDTTGASLRNSNAGTQAVADAIGATIGSADNLQAKPEPQKIAPTRGNRP